jgi:hypothetical protein
MRFMECTPGITEPNLTAEPLGTEAEMTAGPADYNPFEDTRQPATGRGDADARQPFGGVDEPTDDVELPRFDPLG